tara:strand:+ start:1980 stop:2399 length:420 start_codon:yes stop_codon:yes gene_type:complete
MYVNEILVRIVVQFGGIIRSVASSHDITSSQALTLLSIPFDGTPVSSLSKQLGLDISTLSRNLEKLILKDLILKKKHNKDSRIILIFLSQNGQSIIKKFEDDLKCESLNFLKHLELDCQQNLLTNLEKLLWAIDCYKNQ